jgi:hypothetical protein
LLDGRERQFHIEGTDGNAEDVRVAWHNPPSLAGQTIILDGLPAVTISAIA